MSSGALDVSTLDRCYRDDDRSLPLWRLELQDIARGFCGGLIVALPLLYTLEMWDRARYISTLDLMLVLVIAYFVNVGACYFCGFKSDRRRGIPWLDALTAMGIGAVAAIVTLLLIGRFGLDTPPRIIVSIVTLELLPVSLGASLAMNQLGGGNSCEDGPTWGSVDIRKLMATAIGAILFAFNVAPTVEPKLILTTITEWHVILLAAFSLFVSWLMVYYARFHRADERESGRVFTSAFVETVLSYFISLLVSAAFLWTFGYIGVQTDWDTIIPWVIVLGYATTLGGSAGRLIL